MYETVVGVDFLCLSVKTKASRYDQTVIVFVPGRFNRANMFVPWMQFCAEQNFTAMAVNFEVAAGRGLEDYAADLEVFVKHVAGQAGRVILVGHDTGAAVAYRVAAAWPGLVKALVLVNPTGFLGPCFELCLRAPRLWLRNLSRIFSGDLCSLNQREVATYFFNKVGPNWATRIHYAFREESGRVLLQSLCGLSYRKQSRPMLTIVGRDDRLLTPRSQASFGGEQRDITIRGCNLGHMIPLEDALKGYCVLKEILHWLDREAGFLEEAAKPSRSSYRSD